MNDNQMTGGGVFWSKPHECQIVKDYLDQCNVDYVSIQGCPNADDADVEVSLPDGRTLTIEVKEELAYRWMRYGQIGIDGISVCAFIDSNYEDYWKLHPYKPSSYSSFLSSIDTNKYYKPGKIEYSSANVWLFACYNYDDGYDYLEGFWGYDIQSDWFKNYLKHECDFAVNQKDHDDSQNDSWNSQCWYVSPANMPCPINWYDEGYCKPIECWTNIEQ